MMRVIRMPHLIRDVAEGVEKTPSSRKSIRLETGEEPKWFFDSKQEKNASAFFGRTRKRSSNPAPLRYELSGNS
jgi:hypothetical protein